VHTHHPAGVTGLAGCAGGPADAARREPAHDDSAPAGQYKILIFVREKSNISPFQTIFNADMHFSLPFLYLLVIIPVTL
jgi:hypothetical protein